MNLDGIEQVPIEEQVFAPMLADWHRNNVYDRQAGPGEFGASTLGDCARALSYAADGVERTDPMDEGGWHATAVGTLVHYAIQSHLERPAAAALFDEVETEIPWRLEDTDRGIVVASRGDILAVFDPGRRELSDIKTIAPFGFKMKSTGEGPDRGHLLQVGVGIKALRQAGVEVDFGRIIGIAPSELKGRDRVDPDMALDGRANRYVEWVFHFDAVAEIVEAELDRLAKIKAVMAAGRPVPRSIPGQMPLGARVVDVGVGTSNGTWQLWKRPSEGADPVLMDSGQTWKCRYCDWRGHCRTELEAGR